MSARDRRRRQALPPSVKVAFENGDESDSGGRRDPSEENLTSTPSPPAETKKSHADADQIYQRAFFTINRTTVEVVLDNDLLTWADIGIDDVRDETNPKKAAKRANAESIELEKVYAISPIYAPGHWSLNVNESVAGTTISTSNSIARPGTPGTGKSSSFRGFQLHTYQISLNNIYQEVLIIFQSNSSQLIDEWYELLSKRISRLRPARHILTICNPYSGPRHSRHIYNTKVKPMLERAQYQLTYLEVHDQFSVDDLWSEFNGDFNSIDGLVILGGDGSVINVINGLIRYLAKENRLRLEWDTQLPSLPFPLCIVPEGTTNIICHSFQGNTDHYTAVLHLLYDHRMNIDMSAIFDNDCNFVTANFSTGAGYPANVLKYFPRYSLNSPKTVIRKSFSKATANKNLQPIAVDIRYIPADESDVPSSRCFRGCPKCTPEAEEKCDDRVQVFDHSHLQERKKTSNKKSSSINRENSLRLLSARKTSRPLSDDDKPWKTLHEQYLQIAVLTNACLWSFASQGLSKTGHLADGVLDLILIHPTNRKEFLRYIRRNGNSKNQFELPFTRLLRVKEVEIELKIPADLMCENLETADNPFDSSSSDHLSGDEDDLSDNEDPSSVPQRHKPHPPSAPISEESRRHRRRHHRISEPEQEPSPHALRAFKSVDGSTKTRQPQSENEMDSPPVNQYGSNSSLRRSGIFQSLRAKAEKINLPRPFSGRGKETDEEKQSKKLQRAPSTTVRPARSLLSVNKAEQSPLNQSRDSFSTGVKRRPSVLSRSSSVDNAKLAAMKATSRRKKQPCMWNLDFSPYNSSFIRIKCFYRYLPVFGMGVGSNVQYKEVTYSCFGRMG